MFFLAAALALGAAYAAGSGSGSAPKVILETAAKKSYQVKVEVANDDLARARGLMFRRSLGEDSGMLFIFPDSEDHAFWMKNTLIPLDMIFIGEDGQVVGVVERAAPQTLNPRSVGAPSRYVLEVNGGYCAKRGIAAGDRVRFEGVPRF
jgi:hypothetical protein